MKTEFVEFVDWTGAKTACSLENASELPVERFRPVRRPAKNRKRGLYLFSVPPTGEWPLGRVHVVFEGGCELENLWRLDFAGDVVGILGQPLRFVLEDKTRIPDFFVRLRDGRARVYDVKPSAEAEKEEHIRAFAAARRACEAIGWEYAVLNELPEPLNRNLRWLAGYRFSPADPFGLTDLILSAAQSPTTIAELDALHSSPAFVRPIVFHLIWTHVLETDLASRVLDRDAVVRTATNEEER
jgi:hypothetical protein